MKELGEGDRHDLVLRSLQGAAGKLELYGRLDRIQGSHDRELRQHVPADMRTDGRSAIECPRVKKGRSELWRLGRAFVGGVAALSINDPPPVVTLSISDFLPRPLQPERIDPSESPGSLRTLCLSMAFVDMDAINFYEQPPAKGGPRGEKRPPASNGNVPTVGEQYESRQAFGPSNRPSGRPHDCDLIEVLDMTTSPPDEPLDPSGEVGAGVKQGTGVGARGRLPHSAIPTMVDGFVDTANECCVDRGHGCIGSDPCQEFPSLEEVLSSTKAMQEPQRAGGSGVRLTGRSGESLDHALEKDCKESDSLKSGWGKSQGANIYSVCR